MDKIDVILPAMGEGIVEATIIKIFVKSGNKVKEDDILVEIATDKVDSEITAPEDGIIGDILFSENDVVSVGKTIMYLQKKEYNPEIPNITENQHTQTTEINVEPLKIDRHNTKSTEEFDLQQINADDIPFKTENGIFISPLARNIIKQENITNEQISTIKGSGINSRITKRDVLLFLETPSKNEILNTKPKAEIPEIKAEHSIGKSITQNLDVNIIKMDRIRQLISQHMMQSIQTSAHVTSAVETDMTNIVNWRNRNKNKFQELHNEKITFTPIFIQAVAKAIKDFPMINVSVDGENIIKKNHINIGMATALPNGNLIVPVIKNADLQNLLGLSKTVNDLANRSRINKLTPDEIQGGTFTITNFGTFDNIFGTPIINQPEVAILGIGAIKKQVSVIETPNGDSIGIRQKIILSLSYDHRVVDGALGGMFLKRISDYLESFNELDLL
jgi:2-oxoglutarate dehydrogenase E2 component (dihydrolipoamide succinyltransferase)